MRSRTAPLILKLSWNEFHDRLRKYAALSSDRRGNLLFRGQSNGSWKLETTLDRNAPNLDKTVRNHLISKSLSEFQSELVGLTDEGKTFPEGDAGELLARHYGMPSPLMDWTQSPFIASFFAYDSARVRDMDVAVWRLDRSRVDFDKGFDLIDDRMLLRFNKRAIRQRSVFLRVNQQKPSIESLIGGALIKYELSIDDARQALSELDEMGINATMLFGDVEGAARTAWSRSC